MESRSWLPRRSHLHRSDFHGLSQIAATALEEGLDLIEDVHGAVAGALLRIPTVGAITAFVYRKSKSSTRVLHRCLAAFLRPHEQQAEPLSAEVREAMLAALNDLVGGYLAASANPMQIPMRLRSGGKLLLLERQALAVALLKAGDRVLVLIHGLCRFDLQWRGENHDMVRCWIVNWATCRST